MDPCWELVKQLREALEAVQWGSWMPEQDGIATHICPECDQSKQRGHSPDCRVGMALENARDARIP